MKFPLRGAGALLASALFAIAASPALADNYPSKPITIVVPFPPGGTTDVLARTVGQKLTDALGQPVIVDNRPGAGATIGAALVAKSKPDGYTLLVGHVGYMAAAPGLYRELPYDPVADFDAVVRFPDTPMVLECGKGAPAAGVGPLMRYAREHPGKVTFANAGVGSAGHLVAALFATAAKANVVHVPYKGNAPALVDLIGGQISFMLDQISTSIPYIAAGKLRPIAVTTLKRSTIYPQLPTISEAGLPGYEAVTYNGIAAPAATPRDVLARLHAEIAKAVQTPELKNRYLQQGIELTASASPDEFTAFVRKDVARMAKLARDAGIKAD